MKAQAVLWKRLDLKIGLTMVAVLLVSFALLLRLISGSQREGLVDSQKARSILVANMIHETLDKDMMAFRADMVRHLMGSLKNLEGVVRLQIVRGDAPYIGAYRGIEEAFQDRKTLEDVKRRIPTLFRPEWETGHPDLPGVIAMGSDSKEFKSYFEATVKKLSEEGMLARTEEHMHDGILDSMYLETIDGRQVMTYLRPLPNFQKCALCHGADHKIRGILYLSTDMEPVNLQIAQNRKNLIMISVATIAIIVILLSLMTRRMVLLPVNTLLERIREIAEGEGDLTKRVSVATQDEIGEVGRWFNAFVEKLHRIVSQVRGNSRQVEQVSRSIVTDTRQLKEGATIQLRATEDSTRIIGHMNSEIRNIADHSESLAALAEESAVAVLQMSATNEEIARNASGLSGSVEKTSELIVLMSTSVRQIDDNLDELGRSSEGTAAALGRIDSAIKDIQANVHDAVSLSQDVAQDAEQSGRSVAETTRGIGKIQESSEQISAIIGTLHERTAEIGKILNVIDEVAEQTNLLALNAAIIAAQAGEHGKGFSVVAGQIKELAERTGSKTKEIQGIIRGLQDQGEMAVKTIQRGALTVRETVALSTNSGAMLGKILESANKSRQRIEGIARSGEEQTRQVRTVIEAMSRVTDLVRRIGRSTHEQSKSSESLIQNAATIREIAISVKNATHEQHVGNKQINEIVERVNRMVKEIAAATGGQAKDSENILRACQSIQQVIEREMETINRVGSSVEELARQSARMALEIEKFKL